MSVSIDPCASPPLGTLSCYVTTATAVAAAITFSASGAAPTPLYQEYQEHFGLTAFMITVIFAAYVVPASGAAHGRIAVGLHRAAPRDPDRSGAERMVASFGIAR
jgi:hypothetical protein